MGSNVFFDIVGKKICTEATKACIRRDSPPHIAEWKCYVINMAEKTESIERSVELCSLSLFGL